MLHKASLSCHVLETCRGNQLYVSKVDVHQVSSNERDLSPCHELPVLAPSPPPLAAWHTAMETTAIVATCKTFMHTIADSMHETSFADSFLNGSCCWHIAVFSRVSSEMAALSAAGLAYELVPGVSSALAAPVLAGEPGGARGTAFQDIHESCLQTIILNHIFIYHPISAYISIYHASDGPRLRHSQPALLYQHTTLTVSA